MASRPAIDLVERLRRLEEGVRHAAIAGVGRQQELVLALGVVQRVVEARDHARGVAEGRMRGDVLDALAVDVDLAIVAQRVQDTQRRSCGGGDADLAGGLGVLRRKNFPIVGTALHGAPSMSSAYPSAANIRPPAIAVSFFATAIRRRQRQDDATKS